MTLIVRSSKIKLEIGVSNSSSHETVVNFMRSEPLGILSLSEIKRKNMNTESRIIVFFGFKNICSHLLFL